MITVSAEKLGNQLDQVFATWEMKPSFRRVVVAQMIEADLMGIDSHGIGMLPLYERYRLEGSLVVNPTVRIVHERHAVALMDAGNGLGHIAATQAMELAMEKAGRFGIGAVNVRNSNHYGAAGVYSNMARKRGMIGISMTGTTQHSVVPTFGREPRFSTNPIAVAAPGASTDGFSLDMATSTVSIGKITVAKRAGRSIPVGWAIDKEGRPETDPDAAIRAVPKRLTPLGGTPEHSSYKGYGLAMVVEILASLLGDSFVGGYNLETGRRERFINVGHFFLALDPVAFRGEAGAFESSLDRLVAHLRATPPVDPGQPVLVPGDPERAAHADRTRHGIPMTETLVEEIRGVCQSCGAGFVLLD